MKKRSFFSQYFINLDIKRLFAFKDCCTSKEAWLGILAWFLLSLIPIGISMLIRSNNFDLLLYDKDGTYIGIYGVWGLYSLLLFISLIIRKRNSKNKNIPNPISKFKVGDIITIIIVAGVFAFGCINLWERYDRERYEAWLEDYEDEMYEYELSKERASKSSKKSNTDNSDKLHAEKKIAEAEAELSDFKEFVHTVERAAQNKYSSLNKSKEDDYEERKKSQKVKELTSIDIDVMIAELSKANDYFYSNDYKTALKLAKKTIEYINSRRRLINKQITETGLRMNEQSHSNSSHNHSVSHDNSPEYGTREVWVNCFECHGSGKCKYCNGTGRNWYGNEYTTCVVCHGSTNCQLCYGTGGHNELQQYRIR